MAVQLISIIFIYIKNYASNLLKQILILNQGCWHINNFGSPEAFKQEFTQKATTLFGSGWVWLTEDTQGKLSIQTEPNAGNPLTKGMKPILVLDVWEHAYYIDYRNRRAAFIEAFWNLTDWEKVALRIT